MILDGWSALGSYRRAQFSLISWFTGNWTSLVQSARFGPSGLFSGGPLGVRQTRANFGELFQELRKGNDLLTKEQRTEFGTF